MPLSARVPLFLVMLAAVLFGVSANYLASRPRASLTLEMQVALPRAIQVVMTGGDRFLAANIAGFRVLVASTETMDADSFRIQGIVQSDVAWLNPAHEDNYYIAAAMLPWNGEVRAGQYVLKQAALIRTFDWQPAFYCGFNELHFNKNPTGAAEWMRRAALSATDELERIQIQQLAAQWAAKGEDIETAIRIHRAMAKESRHKAFAAFLEKRALRLENLLTLEKALAAFNRRTGKFPASQDELVAGGELPTLLQDPFGMVYVFDGSGKANAVARTAGTRRAPERREN